MLVPEVEEVLPTLCGGNLKHVVLFGIEVCSMSPIIIHHWSYTSGESSNQSCVSVRLCIQIHISVTTSRNFLILGMMMGYGLEFFYTVWYPRCTDKKAFFKKDSHIIKIATVVNIHSIFYPW